MRKLVDELLCFITLFAAIYHVTAENGILLEVKVLCITIFLCAASIMLAILYLKEKD